MFYYSISVSNPDGALWSMGLMHEKEWSQDAFDTICDNAFLEICKNYVNTHPVDGLEEMKNRESTLRSELSLHYSFIQEYLKTFGFVPVPLVAAYDLDPYGSGVIESAALRAMLGVEDERDDDV